MITVGWPIQKYANENSDDKMAEVAGRVRLQRQHDLLLTPLVPENHSAEVLGGAAGVDDHGE